MVDLAVEVRVPALEAAADPAELAVEADVGPGELFLRHFDPEAGLDPGLGLDPVPGLHHDSHASVCDGYYRFQADEANWNYSVIQTLGTPEKKTK